MDIAKTVRQIETEIKAALRHSTVDETTQAQRKLAHTVRLLCHELRVLVREYEYADTRDTQLKAAKKTHLLLIKLEEGVIALSDIFEPADVARLSAKLQSVQAQVS